MFARKAMNSINEYISARYCEMLHNAALYVPIYGNAEIIEGLLCYFDTSKALLVGFDLEKSNVKLEKRISLAIEHIWDQQIHSVNSLEYWGPEKIDINKMPKGVICKSVEEPAIENSDVVLSLGTLSEDILRKLRFVKRAFKEGLTAKINLTKSLSNKHEELVIHFIKTHPNLRDDEIKYIFNWKIALQDKRSILFEVYKGEQLTGFSILSTFSMRMPTYAYGFFDNSIKGTSDMAHMQMICYAIENEAEDIDLGYSIHKDLLRYKTKWGNAKLLDPPWNIVLSTDKCKDHILF